MTFPLRRKRPTTRPSSSRLNPASAGLLVALAAWAAAPAAAARGGELQWRSAAPAPPTTGPALLSADADHSVVVRREPQRVAQAPKQPGGFDPFEQQDAEMPAADPAPADQFDPFEQEEQAPEPAVETEPELSVEEIFDEPAVEAAPMETPPEEAPRGTLEAELPRSGAQAEVEIVAPAPSLDAPAEAPLADDQQQMQDELAAPNLDDYELTPESENDPYLQLEPGVQIPLTPEQIEARRRQLEQERIKSEARCNDLLEAVRGDSIRSINLDISVQGNEGEDYPFECRSTDRPFEPRTWAQVTYLWKASALCHKPLYFEQVQLERYGHSWGPCLQPIMSGAHFFATIPILPYKMGLQTPNECVYTLGHYRPGNCAPYMIEAFPFTWRAAAFQAGAVTGAAAIVP